MISKDPRFIYLVSIFSELFSKDTDSVEEALLSEEEYLHKFFAGDSNNPNVILNGNLEFVRRGNLERKEDISSEFTINDSEKINPNRAVYVTRLSNRAISKKPTTMGDEVLLGTLDLDCTIEELNELIGRVYNPLFDKGSGIKWGEASEEQVKLFNTSVKKFKGKMSELIHSKTPKIVLKKINEKYELDVPLEKIKKRNVGEDVKKHYECVVNDWIKSVKVVLEEKNEKKQTGPRAEIKFWNDRFTKLGSILEQLKEKEKKVVLLFVRNQVAKDWKDINIMLTDEANEAKDNVKYLATLEKYIDPLYSSTPLKIIDYLPGLLKNISMIHSISRYYSTKERMTELFVKITNEMINNCVGTIKSPGSIWTQDTKVLIKNLKLCITLNKEYQNWYKVEKEKLSKNSKGKQFNFDYLTIFGQFNLFCSRIMTLVELFSIIQQFKEFEEHNIDGMERLIKKFFEHVEELKKNSSNPLDYRKNSFDKEYNQFSRKIAHLEQSLQVFINMSFECISSSENALKLLKRFQSILKRDSLRNELENKYTVIFHNYGLQLENVQELYERYSQDPPLVRNASPVAGNIIWARQLMRRIEDPMKKFREIPAIMNSPNSKKIIRTYNKVLRALFKFEHLWLDAWKENIEKSKAGLRATLLVKIDGVYYVNFDKEILQLIKETKMLMRINVEINESARLVLLQEARLKRQKEDLTYLIDKREKLIRSLKKKEIEEYSSYLKKIESSLQPGLYLLTWSSMNIDVFVNGIEKVLDDFEKERKNRNKYELSKK